MVEQIARLSAARRLAPEYRTNPTVTVASGGRSSALDGNEGCRPLGLHSTGGDVNFDVDRCRCVQLARAKCHSSTSRVTLWISKCSEAAKLAL